MTPRASSSTWDPRAPLIPVREQYTREELSTMVNAPLQQQVDSVSDAVAMTNLLQQLYCAFSGGSVRNKWGYSAEFFKHGMHHIMDMDNDNESFRVNLHDGDLDLDQTIITDAANPTASDEDEPAVHTHEPAVIFSLRRVRLVYNVMSTVLKSREFKAILKSYTRSRDVRDAARMYVRSTFECWENWVQFTFELWESLCVCKS